jgi:hypothetical protein
MSDTNRLSDTLFHVPYLETDVIRRIEDLKRTLSYA